MPETPEEILNKIWNPDEPCLLLSKQVTRKKYLLEVGGVKVNKNLLILADSAPVIFHRALVTSDFVYCRLKLELYGCVKVDHLRDGIYNMWFPTCRELERYAKPDSIRLTELINKSLTILNKTQS